MNRTFFVSAALFAMTAPAFGASIVIDPSLSADCQGTYNPSSRSCGSGTLTAYRSAATGLNAVSPGDTLQLRGGTYGQIVVQRSGTPAQPITIEAYGNETVTIDDSDVGLMVVGRTDVVIRNMRVRTSRGAGRLEDSSRIHIDNVSFSHPGASGTTGALKLVRSTHNRITNSTFDEGSDLMVLQDDSNGNVIEGNSFGAATHSLISIRCSSGNIVRANEFDNPTQKAMEIYDCEGTSDAPIRYDDTRRNVVERNRFFGTAASSADHNYNAIQHGGQETIVRLNLYHGNLGGGVHYQYYAEESRFVYGNRLYNNTFVDNNCHAIIGSDGAAGQFYDNRASNNLLYRNFNCSGGGTQQTRIQNTSEVILTNNTLATSDPGFENVDTRDFRLRGTSTQIDAGAFVTRTTGSGSGTTLVVADARYFSDGLGIPGEQGDVIRLQGNSATARIVSIDYASNTLTLDRSLTWDDGTGVHLSFIGSAPDVGAIEYGLEDVRPSPPTTLTAL